jgi:hypothetical protein
MRATAPKARLDGALAVFGNPTFNISTKRLPLPLLPRYFSVGHGAMALVRAW